MQQQGLLDGLAKAGRGNTFFFILDSQQMVLRHYRRGGFARFFSYARFVYTGLSRTRAMREFDLLEQLEHLSLPVSVVYACCVERRGLFYTASLVTHRLQGATLAQRVLADGKLAQTDEASNLVWQSIGRTLARFHAHGVYHADLNAHNIMIDEEGGVSLIDFDRGKIRKLPNLPTQSGWCVQNLSRLLRSLQKVQVLNKHTIEANTALELGFATCRKSWEDALRLTLTV